MPSQNNGPTKIDAVQLQVGLSKDAEGREYPDTESYDQEYIRQRLYWAAINKLADTTGERLFPSAHRGVHSREEGAGPWDAEPERLRNAGIMEYAPSDGREQRRPEPSGGSVTGGCGTGIMGNSFGARLEKRKSQPGHDGQKLAATERAGSAVGELEHPDRPGRRERRLASETAGYGSTPIAAGSGDAAGPVNGFWRNADWLLCRDGKWRAALANSSVLAHGTATGVAKSRSSKGPSRIEMLRCLGNSIVSPQAEAFIRSYMGSSGATG